MKENMSEIANELGTGGAAAASFATVGSKVSGEIVGDITVSQQTDYVTKEPLFWQDGRPKNQIIITLQTDLRDDEDDDGKRRLYVKGAMKTALGDALRAVGVREPKLGGHLTVTHSGTRPSKKGSPQKLYDVVYVPPVDSDKPPF